MSELAALVPASVNDELYKPVKEDDPATIALAASIERAGQLLEPIVVTLDGVILSGHRRRVAARLAGVHTVPVRVHPIRSDDPRFVATLRAFNEQRVKTIDEQVREAIIDADPQTAALAVGAYQAERDAKYLERVAGVAAAPVAFTRARKRNKISNAKMEMLDAIVTVLTDNRACWPLSNRQIHYRLLNSPPLRHAGKPDSRYRNDRKSYHDLCDVLTRARLDGTIPFDCITDATRPSTQWTSWGHAGDYLNSSVRDFLGAYRRDPLQSQPAYIEIIAEKLTAETPVKRAASEYLVPYCIGRGYTSIDARYELAERFEASGKSEFTLLILSDFDPEGEDIARSLASSLADEFGIDNIKPLKVALTAGQVQEYGLVPSMEAKATSSRAKGFVEQHGRNVYELEALEPATLQEITLAAIRSVIDHDAYKREKEIEASEMKELVARRKVVFDAMGRPL